MQSESLIFKLYQIEAIQFGEFTLKSGQLSPIYINLRKIISYPAILRETAAMMWDTIRDCHFDLICGVPYTALPIAACLSLDYDLPMIIRRKEKKEYGTKQMIEGVFTRGQRCLIVEDVVTTGSSIIDTAAELEKEGLKVVDTIALIDRQETGRDNLSKQYRFHSIFTLTEILGVLSNTALLTTEEKTI